MHIAWHRAAEGGKLESLDTLHIWAKQVGLNLDELVLTQVCFLLEF